MDITDEMVRAFRVAERTAQGFRKKPNERVRAGLAAALKLTDRLLPAGGEVSEEWSIRKDNPWGTQSVITPSFTEEAARAYFVAQCRFDEAGGRRPPTLLRRQVTTWTDGSQYISRWESAQ